MARSKSFDETYVLTQAMNLFWHQGYQATSMRDLEKATQLTAGSIYHEFRNKKELFRRSLNFYITTVIGWRIEKYLVDYPNPLDGVYHFLTSFLDKPFRDHSCLLVNSTLEFDRSDKTINTLIQKGIYKLRFAIQEALQKAQEQNLLNHYIDPVAGAKYIILVIPGLLISSKNGAKKSEMELVIKQHMYTFIS